MSSRIPTFGCLHALLKHSAANMSIGSRRICGLIALLIGLGEPTPDEKARLGNSSLQAGVRRRGLASLHPVTRRRIGLLRAFAQRSSFRHWANGGFKYQQIRDQGYEIAICLGIMPFDARCWVLPKAVLYANVIGHTPQHTGAAGSDTFWITVPDPDQPPPWMQHFGGSLSQAFSVLRQLEKKSSR